MKGIVLAGGSGTRLYPITRGISKQLLPIYDKPMIYYPISVLIEAGVTEILIISTPHDIQSYKHLLNDGSDFGVSFTYAVQPKPEGLAQAFIIANDFIDCDPVCLILGDNLFYGPNLTNKLSDARKNVELYDKATIFSYYVKNPSRYGVVNLDEDNNILSIVEKPKKPVSNFAVVGLYFYPNSVIKVAQKIKPSDRGELEITSVNNYYLKNKDLKTIILDSGFVWLDTGTIDSLHQATELVRSFEKRQGLKIACLEEISFKKGLISKDKLKNNSLKLINTEYGEYLIEGLKKW